MHHQWSVDAKGQEANSVQYDSAAGAPSNFEKLGSLFQRYLSTTQFGKKFPCDNQLNPIYATMLKI